MKVYFDNAATTKVRDEVIDEISSVLKNCFGNPSSAHSFGRSAKTYIETSRKSVAKILNCEPGEIIFNSGGTESDNSILKCAIKDLGVKHIISSKIEHHAVTHTLDELEEQGVTIHYVRLKKNGQVDITNLEELLEMIKEPKLVTLMYINNEIGNILDIYSVSNLCQKHNSFFHSDAVQAVGHYHIDLKSLKIDFLSSAGHKFHGPKGIGFVYINKNLKLNPFVIGGNQERGMRAGTESVHNISGMELAFINSYTNIQENNNHISSLKSTFIKKIKKDIPKIKFNGSCDDDLLSSFSILNICLPIPKEKAVLLDFNLDMKGIACSRGSACQSGSITGSHVLNSILSDEDLNKPSLRFSFSKHNNNQEVEKVINVLKEFIDSN